MKFLPKNPQKKLGFSENTPEFISTFFKKAHIELMRRRVIELLKSKTNSKLEEVLKGIEEYIQHKELFDCFKSSP
jgi:hypothetical protein